MYQTRVFSLKELTQDFFKEDYITFVPMELRHSHLKFFTEKKLETPLGLVEVEFNSSTNYEYFYIDFLTKQKKECYLHVIPTLFESRNEKRKNKFCSSVIIKKASSRRLPNYVRDITLEGIRLCELKEHYSSEHLEENEANWFVHYFYGNMIHKMQFESWYCFRNNLTREKEREMEEKYKQWEREWTRALLNLAQLYAGYRVNNE